MSVSTPYFSLAPMSEYLPVHIHVLFNSWHYVLIIKTCLIITQNMLVLNASQHNIADTVITPIWQHWMFEFPDLAQLVVVPGFRSSQFTSRLSALNYYVFLPPKAHCGPLFKFMDWPVPQRHKFFLWDEAPS